MQIPKQMSRPADPSKPSFLDRPGEIRNMIYEILFKRDGSVLLHNFDAYHCLEPKEKGFSEANLFQVMTTFDSRYESEVVAGQEFIHDLHLGLPLLRVCHQIYHEAAGVFYSDNTFVFSRVLSRHDYNDDGDYNDWKYHQFYYASAWLSGIGSQFTFLRKVCIDCDAMCHPECDDADNFLDILPLLRLLWRHSPSGCPVKFASTGRRLRTSCLGDDEDEHVQRTNSMIVALNSTVEYVTGNHRPSVRKYAKFQRLITRARFSTHSQRLEFKFDAPRFCYLNTEYFSVGSNGEVKVNIETRPHRVTNLERLPNQILCDILAIAVFSPGGITLDLESRTAYGLDLNTVHSNRHMRADSGHIIGEVNDLTLLCKSNENPTDFGGFAKLQKLMEIPMEPILSGSEGILTEIVRANRFGDSLLTIALDCQITAPTTMSSLRINIKHIVSILGSLVPENCTVICITLRCPGADGQAYSESKNISATALSLQLFLLLSDVAENSEIKTSGIGAYEAPDIWMNGNGQILNASYPASASSPDICIGNRHAKLQARQMDVIGRRFMRQLFLPREVECESLYALWHGLRETYWSDYEPYGHGH